MAWIAIVSRPREAARLNRTGLGARRGWSPRHDGRTSLWRPRSRSKIRASYTTRVARPTTLTRWLGTSTRVSPINSSGAPRGPLRSICRTQSKIRQRLRNLDAKAVILKHCKIKAQRRSYQQFCQRIILTPRARTRKGANHLRDAPRVISKRTLSLQRKRRNLEEIRS